VVNSVNSRVMKEADVVEAEAEAHAEEEKEEANAHADIKYM
jgi:hypothetical protein